MDNSHRPDVFDAGYHLANNDARLFLADAATGLEQVRQVKPIRILLHHVNIASRLDSLVKAHCMRAAHHAMNLDLLVDARKIVLRDVRDFDNFTGIDLLARVDSGSDGLLLRAVDVLQQIGC